MILIERQLDELTGDPQPLGKRFDLIGGTSTGAILAAGLALGMKACELRDFYVELGPDIFKKVFLPERFWHKYPSDPRGLTFVKQNGEHGRWRRSTLL